jgi:hypothetical protein
MMPTPLAACGCCQPTEGSASRHYVADDRSFGRSACWSNNFAHKAMKEVQKSVEKAIILSKVAIDQTGAELGDACSHDHSFIAKAVT